MDVGSGKEDIAQSTLWQLAFHYIEGEALEKSVRDSLALDDHYLVIVGD